MTTQQLLREIPKVDELLALVKTQQTEHTHADLVYAIRIELEKLRVEMLEGICTELPEYSVLLQRVLQRVSVENGMRLRRVINATGVVLHTNLGRAPLAPAALQAVNEVARGYSTLEYDLQKGMRGNRSAALEELLCALTGAEAAMVVNNNAAAVFLALTTLAHNGEIILSRGEMVEIGDGFRIPDIMKQSGGTLIEVGATNKTYLHDYEAAITPDTKVLLKVHTSNYRIVGFFGETTLPQLTELGKRRGIPVVYDLGSGALLPSQYYPFEEPTVTQAVASGADVIMFSGDKLMGSAQAGILIGKRFSIEQMKHNPLARALRLDKLSIAALEATLRLYRIPEQALLQIPTLRMLCATPIELREKAESLRQKIITQASCCEAVLQEQVRQAGGGSVPGRTLPTTVVALRPTSCSLTELEQRLRLEELPIITRISGGWLLLDVSTIEESDFDLVAQEVAQVL